MNQKLLDNPQKWILKGVPSLFVIGALTHFAYGFLGERPFIGALAAVNESLWEHCKMVLLPCILWWSVYYLFKGRAYHINPDKWFGGALGALICSLTAIPLLYCFYTQAFDVELLWADILILFLAVLSGQLLGLHFYRYGRGMPTGVVIVAFTALMALFAYFTFYPPELPLFQDGISGKYGMG